jgi:hypothetical protein
VFRYSPLTGLQGCDPEYVISTNRYNIFEDFGPSQSTAITPLLFLLFSSWPVVIGTVSLYYCGEYPGLRFLFGALAHLFQLRPFTRYIRANVSSGR